VVIEIERRLADDYEVQDVTKLPFYPHCREAREPLSGGWRLFYFETHRWHYQKETRINVSQPFREAYTSPMPKYLETIKVCEGGMARRCRKKTDARRIRFREDSDECPDGIVD